LFADPGILSFANYCWHCTLFYLIFILWYPDPLHHLISQIIVDIGILFYLLFFYGSVCWGSSLRDPLTILSARLVMLATTHRSLLFFYCMVSRSSSSSHFPNFCWYWHTVLLVIYSMVCSMWRIIPPWSFNHLFYLFFILWFPDPLHNLISHIIVDIGILFYLLFILWFQDPLHHLISQIIVDIGIMFYLWPVIYSMVCSVWRIIPSWSSDHLFSVLFIF
jgi:hypothetical protein